MKKRERENAAQNTRIEKFEMEAEEEPMQRFKEKGTEVRMRGRWEQSCQLHVDLIGNWKPVSHRRGGQRDQDKR